jgi:hypothetical protein
MDPVAPSVVCFPSTISFVVNWQPVPNASYDIADYTVYLIFPNNTELVHEF